MHTFKATLVLAVGVALYRAAPAAAGDPDLKRRPKREALAQARPEAPGPP